MASADVQILAAGAAALPLEYTVPNAQEMVPLCVSADYDGSGVGVTWRPCLQIVSDAGLIVAEIPTDTDVAAGGSLQVSWFPFRKPRTPCPPCPPAQYGLVNCGGNGTGPIAEGAGSETLTLTLSRDIACDGLLQVVVAAVTIGSAFPDVALKVDGVSDSVGKTYDWGDTGAPQIGPVGQQSNADTSFMVVGPTAVRGCTPGDMHAGDTITVTWHTDYPGSVSSVGMAFVIEGAQYGCVPNDFDGTVHYDFSDSFDAIGTTPNRLSWGDDGFPEGPTYVAGMIAANGAYPSVGSPAPIQGTLLGSVSGALDLAFSIDAHVNANSANDPGSGWGANAEALAGNFQFVQLVGT